MAAIQALSALTRPCHVIVSTDSNYVKDGITKWIFGWQKNGWCTADRKPVKNADLWQALLEAVRPHEIERSEEHTSELQSLMRISYAVFCLKKKNKKQKKENENTVKQTQI